MAERSPSPAKLPEMIQTRAPRGTRKRLLAAARRAHLEPAAYHRKVLLDHLDADEQTNKEP